MSYNPRSSRRDKEIIRVAIIGTSGIASTYARRFLRINGVVLECIHSRNVQRARDFAAQHGIPRFTDDLDDIVTDERIQAVLIVTEPERHLDIALRMLLAKKHMLIEKPLDVTPQKAEEFASKAQGFEGIISVVSQKRFDPVLQEMKSRLDREAAAGTPKTVQISMMWHRDQEYYQKGTGWREKHSAVFLNQGIHWLDVSNWFFGEPVRIRATSRNTRPFLDCVDQTTALLDYPDNTSVSLCGGTFCDRSYPDRFTIYHSQGYLDYEEMKNARQPKRRLRDRVMSRLLKRKVKQNQNQSEGSLFSKQLKDFIAAIRQNRAPVTTLDNALLTLKVAHAVSQADV